MSSDPLRSAIERTTSTSGAYPDPDWPRVAKIVSQGTTPAGEAWISAIQIWADALRKACGPFYRSVVSPRTVIVTPYDGASAAELQAFVDARCDRILAELPQAAQLPERLPLLILHFPGPDGFLDYVRHSYPKAGTLAPAGSVCIDRGNLHIVIFGDSKTWIESVVTHELVHALVRHLYLPGWLDEGLAMAIEERLMAPSAGHRKLSSAVLRSLRGASLDLFWKGTPFAKGHGDTEGMDELALGLARRLLDSPPEQFAAFAGAVVRSPDSGRAAARERLRVNLDALSNNIIQSAGWWPWTSPDGLDDPRLRHLAYSPTRRLESRKSITLVVLIMLIILTIVLLPTCRH